MQKLQNRINITSAAALRVVYINLVYLRDVTMDSVNLTSWGRAWDGDAVSSNYWMAPLDVYSTNTDDVNGIGGSVVQYRSRRECDDHFVNVTEGTTEFAIARTYIVLQFLNWWG